MSVRVIARTRDEWGVGKAARSGRREHGSGNICQRANDTHFCLLACLLCCSGSALCHSLLVPRLLLSSSVKLREHIAWDIQLCLFCRGTIGACMHNVVNLAMVDRERSHTHIRVYGITDGFTSFHEIYSSLQAASGSRL